MSIADIDEDNTLIDRIVQGDLKAFETLYDRYASKVLKHCYFICLNTADAHELMQEIWLKVFLRLYGFNKQAAFSTWLYRLTTNHCLNHLKRRARTASVLERVEEATDVCTSDPTHSAEVNTILARLSVEDRTLLAMKYMGDYTYEEIAETHGLSISAVKMRVSRLMTKLRKEVKP
ncbi:MAG: RNA polymerase sigma factor [Nitrospirales bacterium]|nr:RNA polymerase sigma factor [Nitrospira sp.]MDR4502201.1 RNA polymerase sigma factor [Nitrospirales bacterium]